MVDFAQSVATPPTGAYAPALMNFAQLANLPSDYAQGQQNQFAQQQRDRQTQLQQPLTSSDPRAMAIELAQRDPSMAAQLLPFLVGQEPGQVSPLLGGSGGGSGGQPQGGSPAPQAGAGAPSATPAATAPPASYPAPQLRSAAGGGDSGAGTVVDIVTGVLPEDGAKTGQVINSVAKAIGADPNAPLTPDQQAKATKYVQAYAQRNGIKVAAAGGQDGDASPSFDQRWAAGAPDGASGVEPGSRVLHPQPQQARPAQPPAQGQPQPPAQSQQGRPQQGQEVPAAIPGLILPPGFKPGQEVEAVQALRAAAAEARNANNAKTRSQAPQLDKMADEIEKHLQPQKLLQGQEIVDARGNVIRSGSGDSARDIADGIKSGDQPPTTTGLGRMAPQVRGLLAKDGYNLAKAQQEWAGAQKQIQSLNGPQMVRYAGLASSVVNTIDEVKGLSEEMANGGIPLFNKVKLAAYIQTQGNSANGQLAARYMAATNTLKEEFANLAQGGYAPTEAAWDLANQQINGNYGVKELGASLDEVQRLIKYRINGIPNFNTLGPASGNRYFNKGADAEAASPAGDTQPAPARAAPQPGHIEDGHRFKGGDPSNEANWEKVSQGDSSTRVAMDAADQKRFQRRIDNAEGDKDLIKIRKDLEKRGIDPDSIPALQLGSIG
jgi:hypothetical protein